MITSASTYISPTWSHGKIGPNDSIINNSANIHTNIYQPTRGTNNINRKLKRNCIAKYNWILIYYYSRIIYSKENSGPQVHRRVSKEGVTGESVHAPRQRNSTYIQMFRRYIYETKWTKHPHSPIHLYQQRLQGPDSRPRYMLSVKAKAIRC